MPEDNIWVLLEPKNGADPKEIKLYIDYMGCQEKKIRELGSKAFVRLCQDKDVIYDPFLRIFFKVFG